MDDGDALARVLALAAFLVSIAGLFISWRTYVRRDRPRLRSTLVRDNDFEPIPVGRGWGHVGDDELKLEVINTGGVFVRIDRVRLTGPLGTLEHPGTSEPNLPQRLGPGEDAHFVFKTWSTHDRCGDRARGEVFVAGERGPARTGWQKGLNNALRELGEMKERDQ